MALPPGRRIETYVAGSIRIASRAPRIALPHEISDKNGVALYGTIRGFGHSMVQVMNGTGMPAVHPTGRPALWLPGGL